MVANLFPASLYVENLLKDCRSALDIGFGEGGWLRFVPFSGHIVSNETWKATMQRSGGDTPSGLVLDDIIDSTLRPGCADAVLCLDVIEHFPKAESRALIEYLRGLARRVVILGIPNGFLDELWVERDPFHLCGWDAAELRGEGFEVHGFMGLRRLRGPFAKVYRKPRAFWWLVNKLCEPYVWNRPDRAFSLLAFERKNS